MLPVAAMALAIGIAFPGTAQSPMLPATPVPSPWATQSVVIVQLHGRDGGPLTPAEAAAAESVVRARLTALGGPGASVSSIPDDRLRIDVADEEWTDAVADVATAPGVVEFVPVPNDFANSIVDGEPLPDGMPSEPIFGSDGIAEASIGNDQLDQPAVDLVLTPEAAQAFDDHVAAHYGERFAIVRDGIVLSAPTINATRFDGQAQISGAFDERAVMVLIGIIEGGVLPVSAEVLSVCPAASACTGASPEPGSSPAG